ncbi:MAG: YkgJ family cysteine cluster protein [Desulfonatronovibrionaceae bacterium]
MLEPENPSNRQSICLKCGTCCRRNSPVLHRKDLPLIQSGILARKNLILLRRGEPAQDNIRNRPVLLERELFKLRGKPPHSWACLFLDEKTSLCTIHENRPLQCRLLKCWDPGEITRKYAKDTLSRKDILVRGSAMEEITSLHEHECSVEKLGFLVQAENENPDPSVQDSLHQMIQADKSIRESFQKLSGTDDLSLEFYFGRPLQVIIQNLRKFMKIPNSSKQCPTLYDAPVKISRT